MSKTDHFEHVAYAEQDEDGFWVPACAKCDIMMQPGMWDLVSRYPFEHQAVKAAADIFAVLDHPAVSVPSDSARLIREAEEAEDQARSNMTFEIIWFFAIVVQMGVFYASDFWTAWSIIPLCLQIVLLAGLEWARRSYLRDAQTLRERAVLARGWKS